jgi:hypothetical protein
MQYLILLLSRVFFDVAGGRIIQLTGFPLDKFRKSCFHDLAISGNVTGHKSDPSISE